MRKRDKDALDARANEIAAMIRRGGAMQEPGVAANETPEAEPDSVANAIRNINLENKREMRKVNKALRADVRRQRDELGLPSRVSFAEAERIALEDEHPEQIEADG
jgi:endonuclease/exonuclease/phosphatase (EEP) superfamily protein YafD